MTAREELVRRAVAAFNERDWPGLQGTSHPESSLSRPVPDVGQTSYPSFNGTYRGPAEIAEASRQVVESLGGLQVELRQAEELGDDGLLCEYLLLIGPEADRSAQLAWIVHRFRDGLILTNTNFSTKDAAREAIERGA